MANNNWTDFAILTPSKPQFNKKGEPVRWRVQTNDIGQWRCYCPSFIFSKAFPKTCKHIRLCQQENAQPGQDFMAPPLVKAQPVAAKPAQWDNAAEMCLAMLAQARAHVSLQQRDTMTKVLAERLAAFTPTRPTVTVTASAEQIGVRYITFDD